MVKVCGSCKREQPITEFAFKDKAKGRRRSQCRACQRTYVKRHYHRNKDYYKDKARARNASVKCLHYEKLYAYLAEHPCIDCGETDIVVLELDHRERGTKVMAVTSLVRGAYGWDAIEAEIKKCDVRCANCHRRRTAKQFGWLRASVDQR